MKRLLICVLILCFVVSCFAACSADKTKDSEQSIENHQVSKSDNDVSTDVGSRDNEVSQGDFPQDVPYVLTFDSFDKIAELREIANKSSEKVENYLDSNGFSMNGLTSKDDINNLFDLIGNLNMLHLDDASMYNLVEISYYVNYGYVMSTYSNDSDIVRFICYINDGKASSGTNNLNTNSAVAEKVTISGKVVSLFEIKDADSPYKLSGKFETSNSNITILLSNKKDVSVTLEDISVNVVSSTLFDFIK